MIMSSWKLEKYHPRCFRCFKKFKKNNNIKGNDSTIYRNGAYMWMERERDQLCGTAGWLMFVTPASQFELLWSSSCAGSNPVCWLSGALLPIWKTRMAFLAAGFNLNQPWLLPSYWNKPTSGFFFCFYLPMKMQTSKRLKTIN